MFEGTLLPLPPDVSLSTLLAWAAPAEPLGAWVEGRVGRFHVYQHRHSDRGRVLVSSNLGFLLGCCNNVAVREGARTTVLPADTVIHWRALHVATASAYLPGIDGLQVQFPGIQASVKGLLIPIGLQSPEEILVRCLAEGMQVVASRIVYTRWSDGKGEGAEGD